VGGNPASEGPPLNHCSAAVIEIDTPSWLLQSAAP
jgi:hypothetical protein